MASPPRLSPRAEHRFLKFACGLPPRLQRLLFGKPPTIDGQTLASDVHVLLRLAAIAGTRSYTNGLEPLPARDLLRQGALTSQAPRPLAMARVDSIEIPTAAGPLPARHYLPSRVPGDPPPLLVFFHAGGFVLGDLDTHDGVCRFLAAAAGVAVLSVDYRLAPENPFPAATEDAWDSFVWASENAAALGADPGRVAVGGDSAGGNLSAGVALRAREEGGPAPAMQLLIFPVTDSHPETRSRLLFADGFLLTKEDIDRFEAYYLPPGTDIDDPRISVLKAPDLSGLAPAYVATAGFDPLRDEGEAYAIAMRKAGTPVALRRYPGLIHGFANQTEVCRSSRAAMFEIAGALRMGLAAPQATPATLAR
ncbi:MAG TPA: alpha/beta hydrolase [Solirubrobacterales bacterium]|nr:alpha/beta hydrolase [Solirubrobacterales bacterium]